MIKNVETGKAEQLFEDFLKKQGINEETTKHALRRVLTFQLDQAELREGQGAAPDKDV